MNPGPRIESALERIVSEHSGKSCPPRLTEAVNYALFPGGHRIRPRICLAVADACGEGHSAIAEAAASCVEILHCASLVHDDMPCFDDSPLRRGKASVHREYGQQLALLTGDALIVLAFQALAKGACEVPERLCNLFHVVGQSVGMPGGIVAGQAWECEPDVPIEVYHRSKTGALFAAATMAGAAAAGVDHAPWSRLGECLGEAYQVADDMLDRYGDPEVMGKPAGQDSQGSRPNCVEELGLDGVTAKLRDLIDEAVGSVPECRDQSALRRLIATEAHQFVQFALNRRVAA